MSPPPGRNYASPRDIMNGGILQCVEAATLGMPFDEEESFKSQRWFKSSTHGRHHRIIGVETRMEKYVLKIGGSIYHTRYNVIKVRNKATNTC
uniref:AlNc14C201G8705 protein n=1 Tax=Albugo laibachii Nc14 TaxID=890382 RepID=F0WQP4_9STRA|nr:AlNc14C201G8705 [Albugo laibachii Nc14]|eukprot:CCA23653.1 AlNc14C201G8705 [Albugo laibachii Nc14]